MRLAHAFKQSNLQKRNKHEFIVMFKHYKTAKLAYNVCLATVHKLPHALMFISVIIRNYEINNLLSYFHKLTK